MNRKTLITIIVLVTVALGAWFAYSYYGTYINNGGRYQVPQDQYQP
jgi:hypothetical protein